MARATEGGAVTIATEQLDELERFARAEQKAGWPKCAVEFDVTLRLVAIARAALAWSEARNHDDHDLASHLLRDALRGTP